MDEPARLAPRLLRPLWVLLGFVFVALGFVGIALPMMPATVFFVLAAWCFSRSSPRFLTWLLELPVVGPLVRDFRAGLGMPRRAKLVAVTMIVLAVSWSAWRFIPVWPGRIGWVAVGLIGVWYILARVPTRPREET